MTAPSPDYPIIALSGDWHIHNFPQFSRPWKDGVNSRARDIYRVCGEWMPSQIRAHQASVFAHLGDWHMNATNDYRITALATSAARACEAAVGGPSRVAAIHGNHDLVNASRDVHNCISYFSDRRVFHRPHKFGKITVWGVGFNDLLPTANEVHQFAPEAERYLILLHKDVEFGKTATGFIYKADREVKISTLLNLYQGLGGRARFFGGHLHEAQVIKKLVHIVGAPVQHSRGDIGSERGIVLYNSEKNVLKFIKAPGPQFAVASLHNSEDIIKAALKEHADLYLTIDVSGADSKKAEDLSNSYQYDSISIHIRSGKGVAQAPIKPAPVDQTRGLSDSELLDRWLRKSEPWLSKSQRAKLVRIAEAL